MESKPEEYVLQTVELSKNYGNVHALNGVNIRVEKGSIFGILGPNGSGKTTLMAIVSHVISASTGTYEWFNGRYDNPNQHIGTLLETPNFYPDLSAIENLKIIQTIKKVSKQPLEPLLKKVRLFDRRNDLFRQYSLGMKQRLAIAAALVGDPKVLLLDEPTNGLDPEGIHQIRNILLNTASEGRTVIISSHLLSEIERVCTHVAILKSGKLKYLGRLPTDRGEIQSIAIAAKNRDRLMHDLVELAGVTNIEKNSEPICCDLRSDWSIARLNRELVMMGHEITHLEMKKADLESRFLKILE